MYCTWKKMAPITSLLICGVLIFALKYFIGGTISRFFNDPGVRESLNAPSLIEYPFWQACIPGSGRRRRLESDHHNKRELLYLDNDRPLSVVPYIAELLDELRLTFSCTMATSTWHATLRGAPNCHLSLCNGREKKSGMIQLLLSGTNGTLTANLLDTQRSFATLNLWPCMIQAILYQSTKLEILST